ncbi:MAG: DUF1998 domain-containing protein, partial [Actinobacteria bacterium]|nr:DUF1998 domain-containing protein [Actinomycetota bacterium]
HTVYGLDRRHVHAVDIAEVDRGPEPAMLRCEHCASPVTVAPRLLDRWVATPCRRYRCPGRYRVADPRDSGYYRRFYRQGRTRRVVAGEHTGLLSRRDREVLETAFKDGSAPDAPNVLTATPTLEMGIDIGDLSTVMLTSVPRNPANYIQRVGRAGRATGNALVTTFVRSDTHGLYYLAEPDAMISGVVRPPDCYLDAGETLRRQYVAYLMDRMADGAIDAAPMPNRVGDLMKRGYAEGGLFLTLRDASIGEPVHVEAFISLFGDRLGAGAADRLRDFAGGGIESHLKDAVDRWHSDLRELERRRDRLRSAVEALEALPRPSADDQDLVRSLIGQRKAVTRLLREHRDEYPLSALERLGVLPNYTLTGDTVTLKATLWRRPDEPGQPYPSAVSEFDRPGIRAITEFAPGNSFYVAGHRHRITSLGIGTAQEPLYEHWRICADCTFVELESRAGDDPPLTACPRCGGRAIADTGAAHTVLRLRSAMAASAEEDARVLDETDDRDRERYEMATLVDVDPADVRGAWLLEDRTFGAEFVERVRLRTLNLGIAGRPGERIAMGGVDHHVPRFTVCRHCGAVRDVRNDNRGRRPDRLHEGWCKVRSGSQREAWDPIVLAHELATEAIRLVVPVSMYEVDERLASFKGALLLGVRDVLGGNPDHLNVVASDAPNPSGQGRRRFLLIYDEVPGGTGYLGPLADAESVRSILHAARDVIARCPCRHEGRPACHRCLLGVVGRHEYDLVRRDLARDLLDELLEEPFRPSAVATVGDVDIGSVEESELERRFKVALREWADNSVDAEVTLTKVPGHGRFESFDLTIGFGGNTVRYRIEEQKGLTRVGLTLPDLLITRMDTRGPKIAVYLDGYQFHASPDNNHIAADAQKRATVRAEGALVWNLTWDDVDNFHRAVTADPPKAPPDRLLLGPAALNAARRVQHGRSGAVDVEALTQNPMALLLDHLVRPDRAAWQRAVLSAVSGLASTGEQVALDTDGLGPWLDGAAAGEWSSSPGSPDPVAMAVRALTPEQLPIVAVLDLADPDQERWTVLSVLDDSPSAVSAPEHRGRWADWLAWSNLLQFLGGPEDPRAGISSAISLHDSSDWDDLWLRRTAEPSEPDPTAVLSPEQEEELELIGVGATAVAELVRAVLERGAPPFVAGYELDGIPLEAAWPERRVAVLISGAAGPERWDARAASEWTVEELVAALEQGVLEEAR